MASTSVSPLNHQLQANSRWSRDGSTGNINLTQAQATASAGSSKPPSPRAQQSNAISRHNRHQSNENGHSSNANTTTGTYRSRKVACDVCRERKARCDRNQPCCGRCSRLGNKCKYSPPERQETGKIDVAQALETLNSRLGMFKPIPVCAL